MVRRFSAQSGPLSRLFSSLAQTSTRIFSETLQGSPPALNRAASATARSERLLSGSPRISLLVALTTCATPGSGWAQAE